MKKIHLFLLISVVFLFLVSCKKKSNNSVPRDYFVTWRCGGYGFGVGNPHATFFSLTDTSLTCDTSHPECYVPKNINELSFRVPTPPGQFATAKDLPSSIPTELLANPNASFGVSEIDGATTCLAVSRNGRTYSWSFASDQSSSSGELQQFYQRLIDDF